LNDEIKKNKDKKIAIKIIKTSFEKNNWDDSLKFLYWRAKLKKINK
jgi:hypothetical protein